LNSKIKRFQGKSFFSVLFFKIFWKNFQNYFFLHKIYFSMRKFGSTFQKNFGPSFDEEDETDKLI